MYKTCFRASLAGPRHVSTGTQLVIPPFRRFASHHDVPEGNSVWTSLIPKAMRERNSRPKQSRAQRAAAQKEESKEWSPHTFYIVALLIIGSNAMKLVAERQAADTFSRDTKARIGILKDAIQRVHRGEQVDLRRIFGTGIAEDEEGWEEAMQEIETAIAAKNDRKVADQPRDSKDEKEMITETRATKSSSPYEEPSRPSNVPIKPRFY